MKRSVARAISEAYSELYGGDIIERIAMENFFSFDLNQDGLISLEEAMVKNNSNVTIEEFNKVDEKKIDENLEIEKLRKRLLKNMLQCSSETWEKKTE